MIQNDLLLRVANGEPSHRPPVWLMRQAGRILPQYRKLRSTFSGFKEFIKTPHAVAEATLQPVDELGVDAAIIFSDILVIPEAMGLDYDMVEKKGPLFPTTIQQPTDIDSLASGEEAANRLQYVFEGLRQTKAAINNRLPLIGFSGAPWTLAAYMIEGSGSKTFSKAKRFLYQHPDAAHRLLDKLADTIIAYLRLKVQNGADLLQLFDSWAGILGPEQYRTFAIPYLQRICQAFPDTPVTVFSKNAWFALQELGQLDCQVIGLDWNTSVAYAKSQIRTDKRLQGNLDPCALYAAPESVEKQTLDMLQNFGGAHIANLGHGVYPDTPLDNVRRFVDTVKSFSYS
ncbi:MAG: uroporphyrinogen decarboxylase [Bacteroidota bacterium]